MEVEVERISKRYAAEDTLLRHDEQPLALNDVSLSAAHGQTVSLVGPSGCGKSSLLRTIAGLETPDQGRILYGGIDVTPVAAQDRGVGMVFQDYALYPSMKGKGNLSYFFQVHHRTEEEAQQRAREVADIMGVGFETLLGQQTTTLSGGEQQRVAIARCIVRDPTLFLMDEPISNLDAKLRETTRVEMKKLLRRFEITTVYVTHDQQEALFMGDVVAVMRAGRIEQLGSFDDLYYSPHNQFVASFIGAPPMTMLAARSADGDVRVEGADWELPSGFGQGDGQVRVGVRPEGWQVGAADGAVMSVQRIDRISTDRAAFVHGTVAGATATVLVDEDYPEVPELRLTPDWDRAYLFDDAGTAVRVPGVAEFF